MSRKKTTEEFINDAKKIHGDKYNYSKVEYVNNKTKVCIICSEHGEFWQTPAMHLFGNGCPNCVQNKLLTTEEFINKAKKIHGEKYDYSKVNYIGANKKVCIICPKHGEFWQKPNDHVSGGYGCQKCARELVGLKKRLTTEEFINKAKEIHGNKYDYSKVEYVNTQKKVCIICSKHGEFWQSPAQHLNGQGCPKCSESYLEEKVRLFLENEKIKYKQEQTFDWLGKQRLDFYLPDYNVAIECQGMQHFKPIDFAGKGKEWAKKVFNEIKERDNRKKNICLENNLKIIYYNYNDKITSLKNKLL